ncbi:transglycosylase SLT domain-containing protein [Thioalkalivibrio sp. ALMg11]|uniref:transglycosylase SLT domain-containing protein n=1 Tax=Thioalkalivibrio sp. ALMg11 TaxID=1158165 RepID=UPI0009D997F2|nr:transglycosylase SLT domain-containing protein [Thioalkalivibrio sp. ALMg11]
MRAALAAGLALTLATQAAAGVPEGYHRVAQAEGVPADVLYALAAAESGARLSTGAARPWPWTLNVGGRPERYRTYREALDALERHLAAGKRNIDIGLMQVNWHWHEERLQDPARALDPYRNLRIGAAILREQYERSGHWLEASGLYHAPSNTTNAARHRARVQHHLEALP